MLTLHSGPRRAMKLVDRQRSRAARAGALALLAAGCLAAQGCSSGSAGQSRAAAPAPGQIEELAFYDALGEAPEVTRGDALAAVLLLTGGDAPADIGARWNAARSADLVPPSVSGAWSSADGLGQTVTLGEASEILLRAVGEAAPGDGGDATIAAATARVHELGWAPRDVESGRRLSGAELTTLMGNAEDSLRQREAIAMREAAARDAAPPERDPAPIAEASADPVDSPPADDAVAIADEPEARPADAGQTEPTEAVAAADPPAQNEAFEDFGADVDSVQNANAAADEESTVEARHAESTEPLPSLPDERTRQAGAPPPAPSGAGAAKEEAPAADTWEAKGWIFGKPLRKAKESKRDG